MQRLIARERGRERQSVILKGKAREMVRKEKGYSKGEGERGEKSVGEAYDNIVREEEI